MNNRPLPELTAEGSHSSLVAVEQSCRQSLPLWTWLAGAALIIGLTISRRPDALLAARFRAEDGANWYADAYNVGPFKALLIPYAGFLETLERLVAALALNVRLQDAPTLFNAVAIMIQVLPIFFLLSSRMERVIPDLRVRLIMAVVYVALPNSEEAAMNLTNARWHIAILALMVVLASQPASWRGRIFDLCVLIMSGLTGPFAMLLAPVLGIRWIIRRERWVASYLAVDLATALIQLSVFLHAAKQRGDATLGFHPGFTLRLAAAHVWLPAHFGQGNTQALYASHWWQPAALDVVGLLGFLVCLAAAVLARLELRLVLLYAGLLFMSIFVVGQLVPEAISLAERPISSGRWYLIPTLAWLAVVFWIVSRGQLASLVAMLLLGMTLSVGVISDWKYEPYADLGWLAAVKRFEEAPAGTVVEIPVNYPGWGVMTLRKK